MAFYRRWGLRCDQFRLRLFLFAPVSLFTEPQLLFHLELEVIGGFAKLVHQLADLAADLGQTARPEDYERQHHQNQRIRHSQAVELNLRRDHHEDS